MTLKNFLTIYIVVLLLRVTPVMMSQVVNIPDAALRKAIKTTLGIADDADITQADMARLIQLLLTIRVFVI